jgi:hypothetical protein
VFVIRKFLGLRYLALAAIFFCSAGATWAAAPQITAFSPASGTIGTVVTLTGSGFTGATAVKFDGVDATTFKIVSVSKITATAPVDVTTGALSVTTSGGTGKSAKSFAATIGAKLAPASGRPLTNLTVSGAGFSASKPVDIYFDTNDIALAVSSAKGLVSIQVPVAASAQPGGHWVSLIERGSNLAVQNLFTVSTNWAMSGFLPSGRGFNPYENTIGTSNANQLTEQWSKSQQGYANNAPFVVVNGSLISIEIDGIIRAYSSTGTLIWHAALDTAAIFTIAPAAANGTVYFASTTGTVYAFKAACRSDGGVCAPTWTQSIGTAVQAGLTMYGGKLYVPSADNSFHVLNAATGAAGTPIYAYNKTHGTITTPIVFAADGSFFYGTGNSIWYQLPSGNAGSIGQSSNVSPIALNGHSMFYTVYNGNLYGSSWNVAIPGNGCYVAPVIMNGVVYAAGCSGVGAYNIADGSTVWSNSAGSVSGLAAANGVLYACQGSNLIAYNASYGSKLGVMGNCSGAPEIVNGTVYYSADDVTAYGLPGSGPDEITAQRPAVRALKPNYALRRQIYSGQVVTAAED